jgi:hypothetical protein
MITFSPKSVSSRFWHTKAAMAAIALIFPLFSIMGSAQAETIPATYQAVSTPRPHLTMWRPGWCANCGMYADSEAAGCAGYGYSPASSTPCPPMTSWPVYWPCPAGSTINSQDSTKCTSNAYTCPPNQGWTLTGTTCIRPDCTANRIRQPDGSCSDGVCTLR